MIDSVEPDQPGREAVQSAPAATKRSSTAVIAIAAAGLVITAVGLAIWATLPSGGASLGGQPVVALAAGSFVPGTAEPGEALPELVVDVEGAVVQPGVHVLAAGSRLSDAIAAAGGYSVAVDIAAAARQLNLAELLVDGTQIRVPALGEPVVLPTSSAGPASGTGGLIDLNHATAEQLDTLPGIGPVTAQKIIGARDESPFASVDDFEARGVVGSATFEKISPLVTVLP